MARQEPMDFLDCEILSENLELSLVELCQACRLPAERIFELVEYGVIEPVGRDPARWRFQAISIQRARSAERLTQDLGVNLAGAALALELLDELAALRSRLTRLDDTDE